MPRYMELERIAACHFTDIQGLEVHKAEVWRTFFASYQSCQHAFWKPSAIQQHDLIDVQLSVRIVADSLESKEPSDITVIIDGEVNTLYITLFGGLSVPRGQDPK